MAFFLRQNSATENSSPANWKLNIHLLWLLLVPVGFLLLGAPSLSLKIQPLSLSSLLLSVLQWIYRHVIHNWGWAIILLTTILNLILMPMRFRATQSMVKMQKLKPQIDEIQERYQAYKFSDPQRQMMHKEIMDLQRREGVSMLSGCLPMLVQWPLLIAFYRMLSHAHELHQAHWLWLPDLSAPDPSNVLPILLVLSMLLVQLITPSPGIDRKQQRTIALVMPLIFGAMFWKYSSALALYWTCSNIIGILFQLTTNWVSARESAMEME